jgi:NADH dehydrogenase
VVIVGAGFGGLACARALGGAPVDTVVVDQRNFHTFTPFLYQVATALLEPSEAAHPIRALLRGVPNAEFRLAHVEGVDLRGHTVRTDRGELSYDHLVLAAGATNNYFGNRDIAQRSLGLGDVPEALQLRNTILTRFEQAAWTRDPERRARLLRFAVVGGGPTGVELAGALAELVAGPLAHDFPDLARSEIDIVLVEASDAPLSPYASRLQRAATRALERKGVRIRSGVEAVDIDDAGLHLKGGEVLPAATVVWGAGVRAAALAGALGVKTGSHGRVAVSDTLQLDGHPEVFVVGDLAQIPGDDGTPLPMLAQVAIQSARHAAEAIRGGLDGSPPERFHYRDLGTMATQGRDAAVAQMGPLKLSGRLGWLAWLLVHIARIVGLRNRMFVLARWTSGYLLGDRPIRLIAGPRRDDSEHHDAQRR